MILAKDNEASAEDSSLSEKSCGTDSNEIKYKNTRSKSKPATLQVAETPDKLLRTNEDAMLSACSLKVNGVKCLTSFSRRERCGTAQPLSKNTMKAKKIVPMKAQNSKIVQNVEIMENAKIRMSMSISIIISTIPRMSLSLSL